VGFQLVTNRRRVAFLPLLLARLFDLLPLLCPNCGADTRIIAFATDARPTEHILNHIDEPQ